MNASERKRKERAERMRNAHSVQRAIEFLDSMVIVSEMNQTHKALQFPFTVHTHTHTRIWSCSKNWQRNLENIRRYCVLIEFFYY